ncbi:MAG: restriction endonuclease subunit S [Acidimicrobiales bacterium]
MRAVPPAWVWADFGDVASIDSNLVDPACFPDLPHIAPNHIESHLGRLLPYGTVSEDGVTSSKHLFREGHILYSKIRPYLAKAVVVGFGGLCSADMYPISTALDVKYLHWWMLTPEFTAHAAGQQGRSVLPKINQRDLSKLPVPVPPLPEQGRIVAAIEEHFSRLDAAEADLRAALARTRRLMQATLIASIPCADVPVGWMVTTVDEAGRTDLGRQRSPKYHSGPSVRPYLRVANVFEDRLDLSDVMEMDFDDEAWSKYRLVHGDILLNEGQSPHLVGRPAMYRGEPEAVAFTNSLIRFRAHDDVESDWALLVFRRHLHARRFMKEASITTNIAHLALKRFRTVEFPKPPLSEQRRLIAQIRSDLDSVERVRDEIVTNLKRVAAARRSILAAAFSGRLVAQDPADESASVLLERIATERAAGNPSRRKKATP